MSTKKQIIIVSGLSGAGKTTFIKCVQTGGYPELAASLGMDKPAEWNVVLAKKMFNIQSLEEDKLILHLDIYKWFYVHRGLERIYKAIENTEIKSVVSLWVEPDVLVRRSSRKLRRRAAKAFHSFVAGLFRRTKKYTTRNVRHKKRLRLLTHNWRQYHAYRDPGTVGTVYKAWFDWVIRAPTAKHVLLDSTQNFSVITEEFCESEARQIVRGDFIRFQN